MLLGSGTAGRLIGKWQIEHHPSRKLGRLGIAEGAIFALLGLLIAFTFSGAYERFQLRITDILEEANAINTAYLRLDLLSPDLQKPLRDDFRQYIDARYLIYQDAKLYDFNMVEERIAIARQIQLNIWNHAITALKKTNDPSASELLLGALNNMFDNANMQFSMSKVHPPLAIFALLMVLSLLSTFLIGYSITKSKIKNRVHVFSYILITSLTLYVILDLELPRVGLIRVTPFDSIILDLGKKMK